MNSYAREYYHKHKKKHIKLVLDWKKRNPERLAEYKKSNSTPEGKEKLKERGKRHREKNRESWREYQRGHRAKQQQKLWKSKIIIKDAIKRKFGYHYSIDKDGNILENKIKRKKW